MIVMLTDFQNTEYVGVMKGVIYSIAENARIVDFCHTVKPHNIRQAAWLLLKNYSYFPKKAIFLCVVDPGVGSRRQAVAVKTKNYCFVGPDNGLLWPAAQQDKIRTVVKLDTSKASKTFHGRDVFARAAALLENGASIGELGIKTKLMQKLEFISGITKGEVVHIDHFGNIVTNIKHKNKEQYRVRLRNFNKKLRFHSTYAEAKQGELFLVEGSSHTLEVSLKNGNANEIVKAKVGDVIELE